MLRGGIRMSIGNFLESLSQQILVRIILVGRLGVNPPSDAPEPGQLRVGLEPILQRPGAGRRLRHPRRSGAERALVWYVCVCVCVHVPSPQLCADGVLRNGRRCGCSHVDLTCAGPEKRVIRRPPFRNPPFKLLPKVSLSSTKGVRLKGVTN